jgi:hypothetical protein
VVTNYPCIETGFGIFKNAPTGAASIPDMFGFTINCTIVFINDTLFTQGAVLYFGASNNVSTAEMKQF